MKLKWQIGTIALLSLSFPLLMWYTLSRLNHSYQQNLLIAGQQQTELVSNSIEQYMSELGHHFSGIVPQTFKGPFKLDGIADEWQDNPAYHSDKRLQFRIGTDLQHLYLWIKVADSSIQTHRQTAGDNPVDRITIAYVDGEEIVVKHINRQAEGFVGNSQLLPLKAYWHETAQGYSVEVQLPLKTNRFGIVATDLKHGGQTSHYGHYNNNLIQLKALFKSNDQWQQRLRNITPENSRLTLRDEHNRIYYDINKVQSIADNKDWLTTVLYPLIFATDNNGSRHNLDRQVIEQDFAGGQLSLSIAHPSTHRNLIRTFIQTIGWLFVIALLLLLVFLAYATLLAWRIRRLSRQLRHVLDDSGTIHKQMPSMKAADEVGDLSRDLHQLLRQIDEYTDYLKQLGSRLSHEMKTPIGIIQSSLDNVSLSQLTSPQKEFINRASNANHRLKFILSQLSALSRLQQAINDNERHHFDLNALLTELIPAYQSDSQPINYQGPDHPVMLDGNADLMAQLLDKVIENALDFSPPQKPIEVVLSTDDTTREYQMSIRNQGSTIPADKLSTVFETLHSYRKQSKQSAHLGIGLYLAKLIARFHQADIRIENRQQPEGVMVIIRGKYQAPPKQSNTHK